MKDLPKVCLSIKQPWAWLIVHGFKDIENRSWPTKFRGRIYVHAGKSFDDEAIPFLESQIERASEIIPDFGGRYGASDTNDHFRRGSQLGGIVGAVDIVGCVTQSDSNWFFGEYGFKLANAEIIEFMPCLGKLGFFPVPAIGAKS